MPILRRCLVIVAFVAVLTACSGEGPKPRQSSPVAPSSSASASPEASAFCLNLNLLQIAITLYRGDLVRAYRSQTSPDLTELRRQSGNVARIGEPMRADAPADIRDELNQALGAVAASAKKLRAAVTVKELVDMLFNPKVTPAFDAVGEYTCP